MVNGTAKKPCHYCGNIHYLVPYRQSESFVICSVNCWREYCEGWVEEKRTNEQQLH